MMHSQIPHSKTFLRAEVYSLLRSVRTLLTQKATGSCVRILVAVGMCAAFASMLLIQGTPTAFAAQAKAPTYLSYYMYSSSTSEAYTLGCNLGKANTSYGGGSTAVLDFGGQWSNGGGTLMINDVSISNSQIKAVAEQFSYGFWNCSGSAPVLHLGIGTNNSYYDVSSSGGKTWVNNVAAIQSYNKSKGYYPQVLMYGADDIEPSWSSASAAIAWANGFASVSGYGYFDYGSADGCPETTATNGSCNNGWNQYDVYYVSWGAQPAHPTPEIYYQANADQWAMISLYGANYQGGHIVIWGPMDEYPLNTSTNTAAQAWNEMWNAVNARSSTAQNFGYSLEITGEP
jgi:hypothetical protein